MNEIMLNEHQTPQELMGGWAKIDTAVEETIQEYKNLVFTDENIKDAKSILADLNKLDKNLDEAKKMVKNKIMAEYNEFEPKVKDTRAKVLAVSSKIKTQTDEYEANRRAARKEEIRAYFDNMVARNESTLCIADEIFSFIYKSEWENASCTMKKYKDSINDSLLSIGKDLESIEFISNEDNNEQLMKVYLKSFDMRDVYTKKDELDRYAEAIKKRAEEKTQRALEQAAIQTKTYIEAREKELEEKTKVNSFPSSVPDPQDIDDEMDDFLADSTPTIPTKVINLVLKGISDNALQDLIDFMDINEIDYSINQ